MEQQAIEPTALERFRGLVTDEAILEFRRRIEDHKKHVALIDQSNGKLRRRKKKKPPQKPVDRDGIVYFLQAGTKGPIKIGVTKRGLAKRVKSIQCGCWLKLTVITSIPTGGPALEYELHQDFKHLRLNGEWFRPSAELLNYIASIKAIYG